ncbi:hypothetical protein AV955_gp097 [Diadromus pulchellus ascovirus 4a]|uniref:Complete DpAV4 genome n=1 Tax=Diadromus pulchellus ascovirus 4a TaxID=158683 RepID=F2NZ26_9VIRU|nr:hypothetical protein AV955_gp097 [Diadromus pulchellus ascovirus 4a]CCA61454.1 unnamed protein product [Diadromus pulchellus ascovirus 4a]
MFLIIMLCCFLSWLIYMGYYYKNIIMFLSTALLNDAVRAWYIKRVPKAKSENASYRHTFRINNDKYTVVVPESQIKQGGILAMIGTTNCTKKLKQFAGPGYNFFGFDITPRQMGLDSEEVLNVWKNRVRYTFTSDDVIAFTPENVHVSKEDN